MSTSAESHPITGDTGERSYAWLDDGREGVAGLRATIDLAPVGIAQFDQDGRFLLVNSQLCAILGYARDELLARTFHAITFPDDLEACVAANAQLAAGAIPSYQTEKRFVRGDGSAVWVRVTVSAVRRADGGVAFFVGVAEDVTERRAQDELHRRADERLRESEARLRSFVASSEDARRRAEQAARARDELLAVVAHDLRNPLHTIHLGASLFGEPSLGQADRLRHARIIQHVTASMDQLIGDLLDVARMEAGSFAITKAPATMRAVLDSALEMMQPQLEEASIALIRDEVPDDGAILCDEKQLRRAISNLIANAIRFTPAHGRITVRSRRLPDGIQVSVEDTGPGITREDIARVFDRFWQADRTGGGAGLGLVIARGIVESHGGSMWVESEPGQGTRFHFTLP